jgi:hypothetical protein
VRGVRAFCFRLLRVNAHMKYLLLFVGFTVTTFAAEDKIPQVILATNRVAVGTRSFPSLSARMEVLDRAEYGSLVKLFTTKSELSTVTYQPVERRVDGELVIIEALQDGVGTTTEKVDLYDTYKTIKHKGTMYRVFNMLPREAVEYRENVTVTPNPAWVEQQRVKRSNELASRVIAFQTQQAEKGLGSFQLSLGKRYLTGDGVKTNLALALRWLEAASTNGEAQASNLLKMTRTNPLISPR